MARFVLVALALVVTGCQIASPILASDGEETAALAQATTTLAEMTETTVPDPDLFDVNDAAVFLAAVEEGLGGTRYSGTALADPETYLATAGLFCSLLDEGLDPARVLIAYIAALTDAGTEIDHDDLVVGSVILGAGIQVFCPRHLEALDV